MIEMAGGSTISKLQTRQVLAIVANVKQFRVPFYTRLAERLGAHGIVLRVAYAAAHEREGEKQDSVEMPAPVGIRCPRLYLLGGRVLLQRVPLREILRSDLIIVVQANGYLLNYPLLIASVFGIKRVAYWGHGYNHQARRHYMRERFKRLLIGLPQWWFAYTDRTKSYLEEAGVPGNRITIIENAVDTAEFSAEIASVSQDEMHSARLRYGISEDSIVGLYCGSLYPDKQLPFLISACREVSKNCSRFVLFVVGAGPDSIVIERAATGEPWMRYCGPQFGREKAVLFRLAHLFLNPGLVGLAILDAFAAGLPIITTDIEAHSPEIAYLQHGVNGCMVSYDEHEFAEQVLEVALSPMRRAALSEGAVASSRRYSLDNMVENVVDGIVGCLNLAKGRSGERRREDKRSQRHF